MSQIYLYPNKTTLQNNDLFAISDEETVDHETKKTTALQAKNSIFNRSDNTYVPIFTSAVGITTISNIISHYQALDSNMGNWVQVSINYNLIVNNTTVSVNVSIPFGGDFTNSNDALFVGYTLNAPFGGGAGIFSSTITAEVGTKTVLVNMYPVASLLATSLTGSMSFIYRIR